jgi:hypothetical protein
MKIKSIPHHVEQTPEFLQVRTEQFATKLHDQKKKI